jgi:hypothetical protein
VEKPRIKRDDHELDRARASSNSFFFSIFFLSSLALIKVFSSLHNLWAVDRLKYCRPSDIHSYGTTIYSFLVWIQAGRPLYGP